MSTTPDSALADPQAIIAGLRRQLAASNAERDEALAQQTATAEVLGVINASPGDLAPVFDAMLEKALGLCEATFGQLATFDGVGFRAAAWRGYGPRPERSLQPSAPVPGTALYRLVDGENVVHVPDITADETYRFGNAERRRLADEFGARTAIWVALRKDQALHGVFMIYRQEVRPFTNKQIALLQNFAAQAVIAMENARLITETRQALEQQTATAEVLGVINSSPGDLTPVFNAILDKAHRLCDATRGTLFLFDGETFRAAAMHGYPAPAEGTPPRAINVSEDPRLAALLGGERHIHVPDLTKIDDPIARAVAERGGVRTNLLLPLRRDGALLGVISCNRHEVRPFSDKDIALLENFAAQAVIAMENARLITETREALDQQTATAEVLQVINSSPGDLKPVFAVILEKTLQLCEAKFGSFMTSDGNTLNFVAAAGHPEFEAWTRRAGPTPIAGTTIERLLDGEEVVHIPDVADTAAYRAGVPARRAVVDIGGFRTLLNLPLTKDDKVLGILGVYRQEVRPFTEKQIALLQNFAAQAVIAMENARLINETREALEQQTATAEILRVISSSATDVQPVFEAIVERAIKLCDAEFSGVTQYHDGLLHLIATNNLARDEAAAFHSLFPKAPSRGFVMGRAFLACQPVVVEDVLIDPEYDHEGNSELLTATRYRTFLGVPIIQDGQAIGVIGCARRQVRAFAPEQIALLRTFADQAVIAIENARLLGEIQQRQAELRVTFDNMADAVVMFDQTLHLGAWNRNFQELLDLPDELLAERPGFDTYIRYLTERGEFGDTTPESEIVRLRSRLADHYNFERTRPDGTVIEVRNNPMPDGGVVVIYSDITERKRSEAEIRAARDAAEAAYADLKAAQANLIQAEKMASLGQLTAGIAHEIKNPLNFVNNFASLSVELLDELKEVTEPAVAALGTDERAEVDETMEMLSGNLEKIAEHGKRADNIVKSMLEHSRGVSGERREVDLNNLIEEALNLAYHGARAQNQDFNITLERDYAASLKPIELAPQEITRVFLNLFGNGFYAANKRAQANGDGSFHPVLAVATCEAEDAVEVRVRDNGTGIAPEIKDKLFQPFFTTKPTGEGTGLGLSISYDVVTQQHGGTIEVASEEGTYTEFTVRLPRH